MYRREHSPDTHQSRTRRLDWYFQVDPALFPELSAIRKLNLAATMRSKPHITTSALKAGVALIPTILSNLKEVSDQWP
jgi:hypothetical protein